MKRLEKLFLEKKENLLNIYFTAGFPALNDTEKIALTLEKAGADMLEIGMPYSDPLADGPVIQNSSQVALKNGMKLDLLFKQISDIRKKSEIPLILMGYFNQVMQFGEERFFRKCVESGVDGLILPDLPLYEYEEKYQQLLESAGLGITFLMTPQTTDERIKKIDALSTNFIYVVSDSSITGAKEGISDNQLSYFKRINELDLNNPTMIGFGISDHKSYKSACRYANGAIIGSAFINAIADSGNLEETIVEFVKKIKEG